MASNKTLSSSVSWKQRARPFIHPQTALVSQACLQSLALSRPLSALHGSSISILPPPPWTGSSLWLSKFLWILALFHKHWLNLWTDLRLSLLDWMVTVANTVCTLLTSHHVLATQSLSCVWLSVTPWTVSHQAPLSVEFPRQGDWSRLPFPPPGDLSHPGMKPASAAVAGRFFTVWATREAQQPVIRCRQIRHLCSLQPHLPASLCSLFNMDPQTQFLSTV